MDPKESLISFKKKRSRKSLYSQKGMSIILLLGFLLFSLSLFAQSVGDYGSISNGDWDDPNTWGVWNGTTFVNDGSYPGQSSGSYDVYIV